MYIQFIDSLSHFEINSSLFTYSTVRFDRRSWAPHTSPLLCGGQLCEEIWWEEQASLTYVTDVTWSSMLEQVGLLSGQK